MAHCAWMHAKSLQPCLTLCNPMDCSLSGFSVHGILQARILEWVAMPSPPGDIPNPEIELASLLSPALASRFFTTSATWEAQSLLSSTSFTPIPLQHIYYHISNCRTWAIPTAYKLSSFHLSPPSI